MNMLLESAFVAAVLRLRAPKIGTSRLAISIVRVVALRFADRDIRKH